VGKVALKASQTKILRISRRFRHLGENCCETGERGARCFRMKAMSISPLIKAPLVVQLNRAAFLLYFAILGWFFWRIRLAFWNGGIENPIFSPAIILCSLLAFFYTFIRARRSRWILAILVILISPTFVFIGSMFAWRIIPWINGWLLDALVILAGTVIPWSLALALFFNKKAEEYFTGQAVSHQDAKTMIRRSVPLISANAFVFIAFSILWVWQYHINIALSDKIDHVVVPWLWLLLFFIASFLTLGKFSIMTVIKSLVCGLVLAFYLWDFIHAVLVPIFDPWF
jgi:hypothetical protein